MNVKPCHLNLGIMNYKREFQNNKVVWKWLLCSTASWQFEELTLKIWESKELIKDLRKEERKKKDDGPGFLLICDF